eukprot:c15785_g1_i1 orf=534-1019(+)
MKRTTVMKTTAVLDLSKNVASQLASFSFKGLEKYSVTKVFNRASLSLPEDVERDQKISEKIRLLQQFITPEHLGIPPKFGNETSWLLAQKELRMINSYKTPGDKLICILSCCQVINNLLLTVFDGNPQGADIFLPVLIYVTILVSFLFSSVWLLRSMAPSQ